MTKENTYNSTCSLTKSRLLPFIKTKLFTKYFLHKETVAHKRDEVLGLHINEKNRRMKQLFKELLFIMRTETEPKRFCILYLYQDSVTIQAITTWRVCILCQSQYRQHTTIQMILFIDSTKSLDKLTPQ